MSGLAAWTLGLLTPLMCVLIGYVVSFFVMLVENIGWSGLLFALGAITVIGCTAGAVGTGIAWLVIVA